MLHNRVNDEVLSAADDVRRCIELNEFVIYYQPIISMTTMRICGVEALTRWDHPVLGLIMPDRFISAAEKTGAIVPLGEWVIKQACRQAIIWQTVFSEVPPLSISVNVSLRQLTHHAFVSDLKRTLAETGLSPQLLKLEITESVMMEDADAMIRRLLELKDLGIQLALDDFGTGYSSMAYLIKLPIDILKIDRIFVDQLGQRVENDAVVKFIIDLAKALNMEVTAEGIEYVSQYSALKAMGCNRGQGYLFSRPVPADAMFRLLKLDGIEAINVDFA